jgi:hypothetical protein
MFLGGFRYEKDENFEGKISLFRGREQPLVDYLRNT